ncbi:hypothetical protein [Brevibacillus panacihumi]|uniref:Uncharacterized protein n=1 Tax=Brevibacillus panacihumi TaxID=497735 RepID=A0A3M8C8Z7_9BACL|nr:hypothetical protein [Brevibacillus panacihumi]RNB72190.1 hypothetical protein EDM58_22055 [Brevibacillus panacihumi]
MDLKRFDLLFVRGSSPLARLIQWVTRSPYSHVAIVLDELHVAETDWRFPLQRNHNNYPPWQYDVYRYRGELTAAQAAVMTEFIHAHIGTPYDFLQTVTNGLYLLTGLPIRDAPNRMNCSETVDRMFSSAGISLTTLDVGKVTPADLVRSSNLQKVS